jgi:hypothetical protein
LGQYAAGDRYGGNLELNAAIGSFSLIGSGAPNTQAGIKQNEEQPLFYYRDLPTAPRINYFFPNVNSCYL